MKYFGVWDKHDNELIEVYYGNALLIRAFKSRESAEASRARLIAHRGGYREKVRQALADNLVVVEFEVNGNDR